MPVTRSHLLVDGPLLYVSCPVASDAARQWIDRQVREMAAALVDQNAYHDRADAIVALCWAKYSAFDVMAMVDRAIEEAKQQQIAREISGP